MNVLVAGKKTDYCATALEDTCIERLEYIPLQQLMTRYPAWQNAILHLMELQIFLTMAPEDHCQSFLTAYAAIAERIQKRDIAHYLGVTPEALSRIRRRMRN